MPGYLRANERHVSHGLASSAEARTADIAEGELRVQTGFVRVSGTFSRARVHRQLQRAVLPPHASFLQARFHLLRG